MVKQEKIIHILPSSPARAAYNDFSLAQSKGYVPENFVRVSYPPYWIGFFEGDFALRVASETLKRNSFYSHEFWRFYEGIDKIYSKKIGGILHRLFPTEPPLSIDTKFRKGHVITNESSNLMLHEINKEIKSGKILLHFHAFPSNVPTILKKINISNIPVIVQHRGSSFKFERYPYLGSNFFYNIMYNIHKLHTVLIQKHYLKNIDYFFTGSRSELKTIHKLGFANAVLHKDGIDFKLFSVKRKEDAKKELGIPPSKKVILYVGGLHKERGVDKIINVYNGLKKKFKIQLILVGASKADEFYQKAIDCDALVVRHIYHKSIIKYYQSSDLYIELYDDYNTRFGGIGTATLEALACGIPVVGRHLLNFEGSMEELNVLGEIPNSLTEAEVQKSILRIIQEPNKYSNCRDVVNKYYNINTTIGRNLKVYNSLFNKYYK